MEYHLATHGKAAPAHAADEQTRERGAQWGARVAEGLAVSRSPHTGRSEQAYPGSEGGLVVAAGWGRWGVGDLGNEATAFLFAGMKMF